MKFIGKVAGSLIGIGTAVQAVSDTVKTAKNAADKRAAAGESPVQAYLGGLSDATHPVEVATSSAFPWLLLGLGALVLILILRK